MNHFSDKVSDKVLGSIEFHNGIPHFINSLDQSASPISPHLAIGYFPTDEVNYLPSIPKLQLVKRSKIILTGIIDLESKFKYGFN